MKKIKQTKYMKLLLKYHHKVDYYKKIVKNLEKALTFSSKSRLHPFDLMLVQGDLNDNISKKEIIKKYKYNQSEITELLRRLKIIENIPDVCSDKKRRKEK